jgi:thiamine-monophosphate kinase
MERPQPRVALGLALRGLATSAIDVSDGLLGDLGHVLRRSGVGARVEVDAVPTHPAVAVQPLERRRECVLAGGDDYELLFTAAAADRDRVAEAARQAATPVTRIGRIEAMAGLRLVDGAGRPVEPRFAGFDHFAG